VKRIEISIVLASLLWLLAPMALPAQEPDQAITRLAFGSCARQDLPQPIWDGIARTEPQLFVLAGDNVYSDTVDPEKMAADYAQFAAIPEFARFRENVPILATWDDHDYGANDAGADYPMKEEAERLFLDFFGEPQDSPRRERPGIYDAHVFGPPGERLQVILLDGRSFRSPLTKDPSPYRRYRPDVDPAKTMLGEAQWRWLAEELRKPAELRLVVSGVRVLGYAVGFEAWKNFPLELEKLFATIREAEAEGVIFLSGDAHFTELKRGDGGIGYPLYELTSSGLSHSLPKAADRPAPLALYRPYGGLNFGVVEIDWQREDPLVTLSTRDVLGVVVFEHEIPLSELRFRREIVD